MLFLFLRKKAWCDLLCCLLNTTVSIHTNVKKMNACKCMLRLHSQTADNLGK